MGKSVENEVVFSRRKLLGGAALLGAGVGLFGGRNTAWAGRSGGIGFEDGSQAPPLVALNQDGRRQPLASFRGRTVLLTFCTAWCGPCNVAAREMPEFRETLEQRYGDGSVAFVEAMLQNAAGAPATQATAQQWLRRYPDASDVVLHPDGARESSLWSAFEGYGYVYDPNQLWVPTWVVIDPTGLIIGRTVGYDPNALSSLVDAASNGWGGSNSRGDERSANHPAERVSH